MSFQNLLFFSHPQIPTSQKLASTIAQALISKFGIRADCAAIHQFDHQDLPAGTDLLVAVGGDGTMLRVARLAAAHHLPVLGVNLGKVGFLVEINPNDWKDSFDRLLRGQFWVEQRIMVLAEHWHAGQMQNTEHALNEIVVTRGALARPVRLATKLDGIQLTTYVADGLIVATPTGSTAYALAAGGPILPPELQNLLLVPIAAHFSLERALVLARHTEVEIAVQTQHQAILSADGQNEVPLQDGDIVRVRASERCVAFVHLGEPDYFYRNLTQRLGGQSS